VKNSEISAIHDTHSRFVRVDWRAILPNPDIVKSEALAVILSAGGI